MKTYLFFILIFITYLFPTCSSDDSTTKDDLIEHSASITEKGEQPWKSLNLDSLQIKIEKTILDVKLNPKNIDLRKNLIALASDTINNIIYATGYGEPMQQAATSSIAERYARKAAQTEALRWASYIHEWQKNINYNPFASSEIISINYQIVNEHKNEGNKISVLIASSH